MRGVVTGAVGGAAAAAAAATAAGNGGCGRTVLGSPYQGVGSAASCPQVTGLMCSVHQSLAPLLSCQHNFPLQIEDLASFIFLPP